MPQAELLFSLGAALWGFAPAAGHTSPPPYELEGWLLQLIEQCADALFWLCFFRACRGARDWVLTTAPRVQLSFSGSASLQLSQLSAARQRLVTRGAKPVRLRVPGQGDLAGLAALPCAIRGVGAGITALTLCCSDSTVEFRVVATGFLLCAAPELATITHLTLQSSGECPQLPRPPLFPQLQHLVFDGASAVETGVGRYVKQLVSLNLRQRGPGDHLGPLFQSNTTHTLTSLTANSVLDDGALAILLDYAPALKQLTIGGLSLESDQHRARQWAVETLCLSSASMTDVASDSLVRLPTRQGQPLNISTYGNLRLRIMIRIVSAEGISQQTRECSPMWRFTCHSTFHIVTDALLPVIDHPIALRNVCLQLASMPQRRGGTQLSGWQWTVQLAQDLQPILPPSIVLFNKRMTDSMLGAIMSISPQVHGAMLTTVVLQSDQYADAAWPWEYISVKVLDIADVVKIPRPMGSPRSTLFDVRNTLNITHDVLRVDMGRLLQWVGQAGWCWREGVRVRAQCPCGHPADQALALLQAQLQVLRAARRHSSVKYHPALSLEHWSMTRAVMQALQGLPQWPCAVHISTSQWPLEPNEYRSLAQYIPTGYHTWHLEASQLPPAHMEQVVLGIKEHRETLSGPVRQPVNVCVSNQDTATRLRGLLGNSEQVTVAGE